MGTIYRQKGRQNWMLKYYRDGCPIVESSETDDWDKARGILRTKEAAIERGEPVGPRVGRVTFDEAATDLLNDYRANARSSLDEAERRIRLHLEPAFTGRRLANITAADVRRYIAERQKSTIVVHKARDGQPEQRRPVSNGEINRELTTLKRIFTLAIHAGLLFHKPHIPMLREKNVRTGFFEAAQFEAVRRRLPAPVQPVVTFAYITGWRIASEVLPLEWRQIDFNEKLTPAQTVAGTVRLDPGTTKNDEGRVFPFTGELRTLLLAQRAERDRLKHEGIVCRWVFWRMVAEGRRGPLRPRPILAFTVAWKHACQAAGCPGRIPHDLRRTAVRNLVRAGISERVAMRLTGHKTRAIFERYNIVSDGDLGEAAAKLDSHATVSAMVSAAGDRA